ncbi:phosphatidylethanolamine-binding protein [Microlunatus endophyticus]|uniref:Phosphatidylethanolamine-binding protein n=1 Tax=Microlunatus endophyticus TaxID=1716077 RepID=A0A917S9G0_9ACTN|nr:YbhB/YbcL family Raf kinase inhibitor-like protein [Microlunatus endophyticus]GGL62823.1 phosphatidylethanolamine-binding protein [Microlunatus endophyticus]
MHPVEVLLTPLGRAFRNRHADEASSIANAPELVTPNRIELTSPSFGDGQTIPAKHCGRFIGQDVSPAFTCGPLPEGTLDLVLVMEDLNSPGSRPRIHTVAAFAPDGGGLAEGALSEDGPGIRFLPGRRGPGHYAGPRPLPGHGPHHYRFHLYALDRPVDLTQVADAEQLPAALAGHVLASGMLTGTRTS